MSGVIDIVVDDLDRTVEEMKTLLSVFGKEQGRALAAVINGSLQLLRKEASVIARNAYTARRAKLFDYIKIDRARKGNSLGVLRIRDKRGLSLIHFQVQPKPQAKGVARFKRPPGGVTAKVRRDGARKAYGAEGASKPFIMKKKQGGFGVFVRHGKDDFEMLYGPSPIQALQRKDDQARLSEVAAKALPRLLEEEIDKLLSSRGRR